MQVHYNFSLNILNIIIMIYLIIDAPKHGKNQVLWAVLGLLFGPIALAIYFFLTDRAVWGFVWLAISLFSILAGVVFFFFLLHFFLYNFLHFA